VIAEKGYGTVMANFAKRKAEGKDAEIISMTGGMATNQIPSTSAVTLLSEKPAELAASLQKAGSDYAKRNGGNFEVTAKVVGKDVKLTVTGVSAHSSEPESGVNPKSPEVLKAKIAEKLGAWSKKTHVAVAFDYSIAEPMYRNPEREWVKALLVLQIATEMMRRIGQLPKL
jgi:hypothetical protein